MPGTPQTTVNILDGERNKWFRPSDVCVAPDGSLFVADWYDPGVGGHRMEDIRRGRIFRVTPRGKIEKHYKAPTVDVTTPAGAVAALKSPNMATRYLAWTALHRLGEKAESALNEMRNSDNPVFQARAMWILGNSDCPERRPQPSSATHFRRRIPTCVSPGCVWHGSCPCNCISQICKMPRLIDDPSPAVRRELLIGMHEVKPGVVSARQVVTRS